MSAFTNALNHSNIVKSIKMQTMSKYLTGSKSLNSSTVPNRRHYSTKVAGCTIPHLKIKISTKRLVTRHSSEMTMTKYQTPKRCK